jgi:hypothetical protein
MILSAKKFIKFWNVVSTRQDLLVNTAVNDQSHIHSRPGRVTFLGHLKQLALKSHPQKTIHECDEFGSGPAFPDSIQLMRGEMSGFERLTDVMIAEEFPQHKQI